MAELEGYLPSEDRPRTAEMRAGTGVRGIPLTALTIGGTEIDGSHPIPVTGPLTDTELRATDVPVTLDSEVVAVDATGQGDVPVTLDSEVVAVDATGQGDVPVTLDSEVVTIKDQWSLSLQADETADDSDKTLTVPASTEWQILWLWVELVTTATVGDRQLVLEIQDSGSDVIGQWRAGAVQAASLTCYYCWAPANPDMEDFRDTDYLAVAIPPTIFLPAGYKVRIYDNNAVAAAADDMVVQMMIASRTV